MRPETVPRLQLQLQTDRQTDGFTIANTALHTMQRGKKTDEHKKYEKNSLRNREGNPSLLSSSADVAR